MSCAQKAIALSCAEAEIYAAVSVSCDGALLQIIVTQFSAGDGVTVRLTLNFDNSAGRSFFAGLERDAFAAFLFASYGFSSVCVRTATFQARSEQGITPVT